MKKLILVFIMMTSLSSFCQNGYFISDSVELAKKYDYNFDFCGAYDILYLDDIFSKERLLCNQDACIYINDKVKMYCIVFKYPNGTYYSYEFTYKSLEWCGESLQNMCLESINIDGTKEAVLVIYKYNGYTNITLIWYGYDKYDTMIYHMKL